ncbi:MAG: hypothetical protein ACXAC8_19120 [Candidatus Hodarchaeales archaeon]|jgi:hypothetical protein
MNYNTKLKWESKILEHLGSEFPQTIALRALILLAFKDSAKRNLKFILELLGVKTVSEKNELIREVYNFFRKGVIAVHPGFPELVKKIYDTDLDKIDLYLLVPFSDCIKDIQEEVVKMRFGL